MWILLEAAIDIKFDHTNKGKLAVKLFVGTACVYWIVDFLSDRVEEPIKFLFVGGGFGGGIMSKSLDMRFHWLRDHIYQGQFRVVFVPGLQNLADFFTKSLPVARHKVLAPFIATDDNDTLDSCMHVK